MSTAGRWKRVTFVLVLIAVLAGGSLLLWRLLRPAYRPLDAAFDGDSSELAHTVVVPTLDTPLPEDKSVIWCSSFQIAWDRLCDGAGGPIQVSGAEEVAGRLNRAKGAEEDLEAASYFADAGLTKDGIADRLRRGMKEKFPDAPAPALPEGDPDAVAVAYAYLRAAVDFETPYAVSDEPLLFRDGAGRKHKVRAFGVREFQRTDSKRQVAVLHTAHSPKAWEFVLDLSKNTRPYQLLIARTPRKESLAATLADLQRKLDAPPQDEHDREFGTLDTLLVPFVSFRLRHRFSELEGDSRHIRGSRLDGLYLSAARQVIDFRLDPMGARVTSSAELHAKGGRVNSTSTARS
jgi:hypothetical protein